MRVLGSLLGRLPSAPIERALAGLRSVIALKPQRSIRRTLLLIIGALTLMTAFLCLRDLYADSGRLARVHALYQAAALGDQIFVATERVSTERDLALSMLHARDADTVADLAARLDEARAGVDDAMAEAEAALNRRDFPELAELRARIDGGYQEIRLLRPRVDTSDDLPREQRDGALPETWSATTTGLMTDVETTWNIFIRRFADIDATATLHLRFKHFLRMITDRTGRARSIIGQIISEDADPTVEQTTLLLRGDGMVEQSWAVARLLAEQSGLYSAIDAQFTDAESHFATVQDMSRGMFYVPGASREGGYPIGPDLWFELSSQASESLDALRAVTRMATAAHLDSLMARIGRAILVQAAILVIALLVCGYSFWVVLARVIRPIGRIVEALVIATRGEPVRFVPPAKLDKEIGELTEVLNAFQSKADETRRTAAELDRSEGRLRAVVDHAIDGLITLDANGAILSFNPACERIFGYTAAEIAGRHFSILAPEIYTGGEDPDLARFVADARGAETGAHEVNALRKDGSSVPVDLTMSTFKLQDGAYYSGIIRDITLRKRAQQTLVSHARALERSNKELDDFAYIASHDLKEPLRGMSNHSRFLLEDNEGKLDESSSRRLLRLISLSQRMERLVNDLLGYSRLGRLELNAKPTDIAAIVRDVEDMLDHLLEENNAKIAVADDLPQATCDQTRVAELIRNLIVNAVKYNDKPEKLVEVGYAAAVKRAGGATMRDVYFVRDNGRGIDPQFHQDVFRIFRRLEGGQEDGAGVGLTFAKKIVERHGGEIWIESRLGEGATFYFTLAPSQPQTDRGSKAA